MNQPAVPAKVVVVAINTAWNFVNFRSGLIRALVKEGYRVVAVASPDEYAPRLAQLGCSFAPLSFDSVGTNPVRDFILGCRMYQLLRRVQADIYLGYTIKPNIYGSIAAHLLGIPVINNIAGLGTVFEDAGWLTRLVRRMYRLALSRSERVFFQNDDDLGLFVQSGLVDARIAQRLPGSGVDLQRFSPRERRWDRRRGEVRFLLVSRMLWAKGIAEFVAAARVVKRHMPEAEFCLLGFIDPGNRAAVPSEQIDAWVAEGYIRYLGTSDEVAVQIADADCVVLPSYYREGVPKVLLEAAALERPIITSDCVGCRDAVDDGVNGFLCRPRDPQDLAEKMMLFASLTPSEREIMGRRGREKVTREFDEAIVIRSYLEAIRSAA